MIVYQVARNYYRKLVLKVVFLIENLVSTTKGQPVNRRAGCSTFLLINMHILPDSCMIF